MGFYLVYSNRSFVLSIVLYHVECEAQPDVYSDALISMVWDFAKYVGYPSSFADYPPETIIGRTIAFIIGFLGIAMVAVPAGLVGSAFSEVLEEEELEKELEEWKSKLHLAFERKLDRITGFQIAPRYISLVEMHTKINLSANEIIEAVEQSDDFRLCNLASTQPIDACPQDRIAIEHFALNTPYGQCIDRQSKVTIFTPSNIADPIMGWWGYYLAKIGGFNYMSRELGDPRAYKSFLQYNPENPHEHQQE